MAALTMNLYGAQLAVEADPRLHTAPVAIRVNGGSWIALTIAEAESLAQQLADAAASLRAVQTGNAGIDAGIWTGTPATADGSKAPLPSYPADSWPTCQPVAPGVDSLGHGFDRRREAA